MGMLSKDGKFYSNPHVARRKDAEMDSPEGHEETGEGEGRVHAVTIHRRDDGRHHVVAHHGGGSTGTDHETLDEAVDKARDHLEGGSGEDESHGGGGDAEDLENAIGTGGY